MIKNAKTVGRVTHTHTHTHLTFNETINKIQGIKFAFICDRLKDRDKASLLLKEILYISKVIVA